MDKSSAGANFTTMDKHSIPSTPATSLRRPDGSYYFPTLTRQDTKETRFPLQTQGPHEQRNQLGTNETMMLRHTQGTQETSLPLHLHGTQRLRFPPHPRGTQGERLSRHPQGTQEVRFLRHPRGTQGAHLSRHPQGTQEARLPRHQLGLNEPLMLRHPQGLLETRLPPHQFGTKDTHVIRYQQQLMTSSETDETNDSRPLQRTNETYTTPHLPTSEQTQGIGRGQRMQETYETSHLHGIDQAHPAQQMHVPQEDNDQEQELLKEEVSLMHKICHTTLQENEHDQLEITKVDGKNLYSVKRFDDLNLTSELLNGVCRLGFITPSRIQGSVLGCFLKSKDINFMAQSQSGTGKTGAYVLSILSMVKSDRAFPQALCIAPTIELAVQITDFSRQMACHMRGITVSCAIRGEEPPEGALKSQIVIGTPGTILDWIRRQNLIDVKCIRMFVLDEADVMLSKQGYLEQSQIVMRMLEPDCRIGLFSATYNTAIVQFARNGIPNLVEFRLKRGDEFMGNITHHYVACLDRTDKFNTIRVLYQRMVIGRCLIFCKTKSSVKWMEERLQEMGAPLVLTLTGDMTVEERSEALISFRDAHSRTLITTNVMARGIDIDRINLVINYDVPMKIDGTEPCYDTYLHRAGRTGRFGKSGVTINLVSADEVKYIDMISNHFGITIDKVE